jgi:hypothetical protein
MAFITGFLDVANALEREGMAITWFLFYSSDSDGNMPSGEGRGRGADPGCNGPKADVTRQGLRHA